MDKSKRLQVYSSDRNGCGYYRSIIPLGYLNAKLEWDSTFHHQFVFDLNLIRNSHWIRFQRQCTENQLRCMQEYRKVIDQTKSPARIMYELDDLVHGIEPHNVLAYQFYTPVRRENVVKMMQLSHKVTFSTKFLKDFYDEHFGIKHSYVIPNFLPKYLWNPRWEDKSTKNKKPTILYSGSASHCGPGGDLEFLMPMIEATTDEFDWLFAGVTPPRLEGKVRSLPWANFWEYPSMLQSIKADIALAPIQNSLFNYAKSDLKYCEYSACNIPALLSTIGSGKYKGPYDYTNGNLVENDPDAWYQSIKKLVGDEAMRQDTLKRQREFVDNRWLENPENVSLYEEVYS